MFIFLFHTVRQVSKHYVDLKRTSSCRHPKKGRKVEGPVSVGTCLCTLSLEPVHRTFPVLLRLLDLPNIPPEGY